MAKKTVRKEAGSMELDRDTPLTALSGVGPQKAKALARLGLTSAGDLLSHYPRAYEDRTASHPIAAAPVGVPVCVTAMVAAPPTFSMIRRGLDLVKARVVDNTGALKLTFFNQHYIKDALQTGREYVFYGRIDLQGGQRQMVNPTFEPVGRERFTGRIVPKYPLTQGLSNNFLAGLTLRALENGLADAAPETLPQAVLDAHALMPLSWCLRQIHFPSDPESLELARARLAFEELFFLTLGLGLLRSRRDGDSVPPLAPLPTGEFARLLPFDLTGAQERVIAQCAGDLASGKPMNRLVQGDVGSGKTAVAAFCLWRTAKGGAQGAMMAPTELLARQHFATLQKFLAPAGITVELLVSDLPAAEKKRVKEGLRSGETQVVVGTHALLSRGVEFRNLSLAVADEQHRFGVNQRSALAAKGERPHLLVMSATPIPRTLALILYGDLDVSLLDELPAGRTPVETFLIGEDKRGRMYGFVEKQLQAGHQVYIVCPAVEDAETGTEDLKAAKGYAQRLQQSVFPRRRVGLVYGGMKGKEKVMDAFQRGELDILVSTTVIEVGMDVPNATLMVVENADRFGLSQLHQLRGRVGRGEAQSYCVLVSTAQNPDTRQRLRALCRTTDGFKIAEEDLKARGPGDFFGARQHGLPSLRVADLQADMELLMKAQQAAKGVLESDPALEQPENLPLLPQIRRLFAENPEIFN